MAEVKGRGERVLVEEAVSGNFNCMFSLYYSLHEVTTAITELLLGHW
jgi:hypothetical protein